jgi:transcriptional regulator with XRE-family HTH domain
MGDRIKHARLRRGISAEVLAERSAISRVTLHRAEKCQSAIALGTNVRILAALNLEHDFDLLAKDLVLGCRLQDLGLSRPGVRISEDRKSPSSDRIK